MKLMLGMGEAVIHSLPNMFSWRAQTKLHLIFIWYILFFLSHHTYVIYSVSCTRNSVKLSYVHSVLDSQTFSAPTKCTVLLGAYKLSENFFMFVSISHSERNIWSRTMLTSHHLQRHYQNCESASTPQLGTSHKTCLRGCGGNVSIAWTSVVSHVGRTSNAFNP
jgi:hypothetical protein